MKTRITVSDRKEARLIARGVSDPQVRAFVKVMAVLSALPSDRSRERVVRFLDDKFAEENAQYVSIFS